MKPRTIHTTESLLARTVEEGDCLLWQGYIGNKVPQVLFDGRMQPVRRVLLTLAGKPPAVDDYVVPTCGNKGCIHPGHCKVVPKQNHLNEMALRAQTPSVKTLRIGKATATRRKTSAKINEEIASQIRGNTEPSRVWAARLGVHKSLVTRIRAGKAWSQIGNPWRGLL